MEVKSDDLCATRGRNSVVLGQGTLQPKVRSAPAIHFRIIFDSASPRMKL